MILSKKQTCLMSSRLYTLKAMIYDKHPRYLLQQNLGIKPPCTSNPEQAALILLLKHVLSILAKEQHFCDTANKIHENFGLLRLKLFQINPVFLTTMQRFRPDCAIPKFHNNPIYSLQLHSYLGITHTSNPNPHKILFYSKYSTDKSPFCCDATFKTKFIVRLHFLVIFPL